MKKMAAGLVGAQNAMSADLIDILTKYIFPSALGGVGGIVATYFNWGLEKKKQRLQRKRELVTGWRMELIPLIAQPGAESMVWAGERQRTVMSSPYYASLRPHLSPSALDEIEDPTIRGFINVGGGGLSSDWTHHFPLRIFVEEIARIEREWKLV